MDAQDEVIIVGSDGSDHIFPAGFDPERAASIVREQEAFAKQGPMLRSRTGQMYRAPAVGSGEAFVKGGVDAVKSTVDPRTYINMAKDAWTQTPGETAMNVVKLPFKIAGGLVTDPAYTLGAATAGSLASHVIPASLPKAAQVAGTVAEQVADKGGWPIRMVGSHMLGAGNPAGIAMMAVPDALKVAGGKLRAFGGADEAASVASQLQRSGARNIETGPVQSIRMAPPTDAPAATTRVPMAHGEPAPMTDAARAQMTADAERAPGGLLERMRTKESVMADRAARPSLRERFPNGLPLGEPDAPIEPMPSHAPTADATPMGKAAQDLALGKRPTLPVGPASTLHDLGHKLGTGIDFDQEVLNQQMATENAARLANRNTKVPVSEGIPASKSKSPMSATPGLTRADVEALKLNPDLPIKGLTPDAVDAILKARSGRHALHYGNAQTEAALRHMGANEGVTPSSALEQALLERLR
jgi:hypothetical protein